MALRTRSTLRNLLKDFLGTIARNQPFRTGKVKREDLLTIKAMAQ